MIECSRVQIEKEIYELSLPAELDYYVAIVLNHRLLSYQIYYPVCGRFKAARCCSQEARTMFGKYVSKLFQISHEYFRNEIFQKIIIRSKQGDD